MKILGTITESDIFPDQVPTPPDQNGELRKAVRVVLFDEDKNIALSYYPPKEDHPEGEYSLPGGGANVDELPEDALKREVTEETGCKIKNIKELGIIKETGIGKNTKHNQDDYCFMAEVDGKKGEPQFTEREKQDLLEVRWLSLEQAIEEISKQNLSFSRIRDLMCLESLRNN